MQLSELEQTRYYQFIQNIINTRGQWNPPNSLWEGHHIIPVCLGGKGYSKAKHSNIIWLTPAEHFIAHRLLVEAFPNNSKLNYAFWAMCVFGKEATPEEYQLAKEKRNKIIGETTRLTQIGSNATIETRLRHSKAQKKELNGFFNKKHSEETRAKLSSSAGKPVRCINTGVEYASSYEAAADLGINRVLINRCCKGLQQYTHGNWQFEYINIEDAGRGIPGKSNLSKYEKRRQIIELRKQLVQLDKQFPAVLSEEDKVRIKYLAKCENYRYLNSLLKLFENVL